MDNPQMVDVATFSGRRVFRRGISSIPTSLLFSLIGVSLIAAPVSYLLSVLHVEDVHGIAASIILGVILIVALSRPLTFFRSASLKSCYLRADAHGIVVNLPQYRWVTYRLSPQKIPWDQIGEITYTAVTVVGIPMGSQMYIRRRSGHLANWRVIDQYLLNEPLSEVVDRLGALRTKLDPIL